MLCATAPALAMRWFPQCGDKGTAWSRPGRGINGDRHTLFLRTGATGRAKAPRQSVETRMFGFIFDLLFRLLVPFLGVASLLEWLGVAVSP